MARIALAVALVLLCSGFEWPGRIYRLRYELKHGEAEQRRDAVRMLGRYPAVRVQDELLATLEDDDPGVRLEAAASAGRVRLRTAVPILLDWLDEREETTRLAAARALGDIGDARAAQPLTRALGDTSATVRRAAVAALGNLDAGAGVPPLIGRLEDTDLGVRLQAVRELSKLGDGRAVVPLLGQARDPSPELRLAVLQGLGRLGDARALPALHRSLDDELEEVRIAAATALGRLANPASADALTGHLAQADARLAKAIIAALGRIDGPEARSALLAELGSTERSEAASAALLEQARRERAANKQSGEAAAAPATTDDLVGALTRLLTSGAPPAAKAAARTLTRLSAVQSIASATPALLEALSRGDASQTGPIAAALAATGAPESLIPLLEWVGRSRGQALSDALDALAIYFDRTEPDGRAADPLLEALARAEPKHRPAIARLLGRIGAPRAVPTLRSLLDADSRELRLAAVAALGDIGSNDGVEALLPLLADTDARLRFEAAHALGRSASPQVIAGLLPHLEGPPTVDRHGVLIALAAALPRLDEELDAAARERVLAALTGVLEGRDEALGERALDALAQWHPPEALSAVALQLRTPSGHRRRAATAALAAFDAEQARPILRYALQHGSPSVAATAAAGLGEVGDERDVKALLRASHRGRWPLTGTVAYALGRMASRGVVKPRAMERTLCEVATSREPYVRANVAAAMALLGGRACPKGGADPVHWLDPRYAPAVREAAAAWLHAGLKAETMDAERARRALQRCLASDLEAAVRAACDRPPPEQTTTHALGVYAYGSDGVTLLRNRLTALRLPGGSVFLGYTDENGHLRVHAAPDGPVRLEDPGQVPLGPAD